ncbi:MAG: helix-turn-helix transcriptional regulator [Parvularculaceae bacterium]
MILAPGREQISFKRNTVREYFIDFGALGCQRYRTVSKDKSLADPQPDQNQKRLRSFDAPVAGPNAPIIGSMPATIIGSRHQRVQSSKELGEKVAAARRGMKLTQLAFANLAGVGRRFVSELERGKPTLEFDKVVQACAAAGLDIFVKARK